MTLGMLTTGGRAYEESGCWRTSSATASAVVIAVPPAWSPGRFGHRSLRYARADACGVIAAASGVAGERAGVRPGAVRVPIADEDERPVAEADTPAAIRADAHGSEPARDGEAARLRRQRAARRHPEQRGIVTRPHVGVA